MNDTGPAFPAPELPRPLVADLRSFLEKTANDAEFGVLVTQDAAGVADDPRIVSLPLSTFLLLR